MSVRGWIGIVGTRWPAASTRELAARAARMAVERGFGVVSGGAEGVDQAALDAAGPHGWVILPWAGFGHCSWPGRVTVYDPELHGAWSWSVERYHPAPHRLSRRARCLHARNYGIAESCCALIAFPRPGSGGTWQAIRAARALGRPVLILPDPVTDACRVRDEIDRFLSGLAAPAPSGAAGGA